MNRLKQTLGELYQFEQMLTWQDIQERLRSTLPAEQYAAVLTTGCVRLDLVLYPGELGTELGYDLYVKDRPDGEEVTIACPMTCGWIWTVWNGRWPVFWTGRSSVEDCPTPNARLNGWREKLG